MSRRTPQRAITAWINRMRRRLRAARLMLCQVIYLQVNWPYLAVIHLPPPHLIDKIDINSRTMSTVTLTNTIVTKFKSKKTQNLKSSPQKSPTNPTPILPNRTNPSPKQIWATAVQPPNVRTSRSPTRGRNSASRSSSKWSRSTYKSYWPATWTSVSKTQHHSPSRDSCTTSKRPSLMNLASSRRSSVPSSSRLCMTWWISSEQPLWLATSSLPSTRPQHRPLSTCEMPSRGSPVITVQAIVALGLRVLKLSQAWVAKVVPKSQSSTMGLHRRSWSTWRDSMPSRRHITTCMASKCYPRRLRRRMNAQEATHLTSKHLANRMQSRCWKSGILETFRVSVP